MQVRFAEGGNRNIVAKGVMHARRYTWNQRFWSQLFTTHTVYDAWVNAQADGRKQSANTPEDNYGQALGVIYGDAAAKVHGVYQGGLGQWFR